MTEDFNFQYQRSRGKRLVYTVNVEGGRYAIQLGQKVLREAPRPLAIGEWYIDEAVTRRAAEHDIESLARMAEE